MTPDAAPYVVSQAEPAEQELNLRDVFDLLWAGKWRILTVALVVTLLAVAYAFLGTPVYEADGLVQVEQNEKGLATATHDIESLLMGESTETEAEIQILQSRLVLDKVIKKLKIEINAKPKLFPIFGGAVFRAWERDEHNVGRVADPLLGLDSYGWGGERIDVSSLKVPNALLDEKMYLRTGENGTYTLSDKHHDQMLEGKIGQPASADTPRYGVIELTVDSIKARPGTDFIIVRRSMEDVLEEFQKKYDVTEEGKKSGVISLDMRGRTPEYVSAVIAEIERAYVDQNIARRSEEAGLSLQYLEEQLPEVKGKVDAAQARLNDYQLTRGSVDVTKETELLLQQSIDLETQRLQMAQDRLQALQRYTSKHPVVVAMDAQIAEVERKQEEIKKKIQGLPQTQQNVLELNRDVAVNADLYTSLLDTIQQLQVAKAGTVGDVRIVDQPLVAVLPAKPKKPLVAALGVVLGLFLGVALIYLQKALIRGVDNPEEVERRLGLPTYAAIPFSPMQRRIEDSIRRKPKEANILASVDGSNIAIEAIRSLRSSLHFAMLEASNNVVMFTGPTPGLGKSFVSINLGVVLALSGKKVVVVDADLRRGRLHRYLGMEEAPGISSYITGDADLYAIQRPTFIENLYFVGRGSAPPNPSELLMHEKFSLMIRELEKNFDYVLVDTAPVLPVADAMIIGRLASTVLVVLKAAEHPISIIEETVRRLNRGGITPKGVIFNQIGNRAGSYGYGGYGYNYNTEYRSN